MKTSEERAKEVMDYCFEANWGDNKKNQNLYYHIVRAIDGAVASECTRVNAVVFQSMNKMMLEILGTGK